MSSVLKKQVATEDWGEWIDGLHEALGQAKMRLSGGSALLARESLESLMRSFHLLKGSAQALGLAGVQAVAHALESALVPGSKHGLGMARERTPKSGYARSWSRGFVK